MDFSIPDSALEGIQPDNKPKKTGPRVDNKLFKVKLTAENEFTYKAKLRLLYKPGSPAAIVKTFRHYFSNPIPGSKDAKGKQKYWTTNAMCPKTIGEKCPICDNAWSYSDLFKQTGDKRFEKLHKDRLPTISFLSNVYVINDEVNEQNSGTVKAWFMSNGVHKKIQSLMFPKTVEIEDDEFADEEVTKIVPFHPKEGVNMMLIANHDDKGWQSYENSQFSKKVTPLADSDEAIKAILDQCHDLDEWVGKSKFKSFDELTQVLKIHDERTGMTDFAGDINIVEGVTDGPGVDIPQSHKKDNSVSEGDSEAFFASDELDDDEFAMPEGPASTSTPAPTSSVDTIDDDDDDDLPF